MSHFTRVGVRLSDVQGREVLWHAEELELSLVLGLAEALVGRVDGKLLRDVVHLFERLLHEDEGDQGGKVFLREPENLNKNMNYLN
jgi:hypothetical protein